MVPIPSQARLGSFSLQPEMRKSKKTKKIIEQNVLIEILDFLVIEMLAVGLATIYNVKVVHN